MAGRRVGPPVGRNIALILANSALASSFFWLSGVAMSVPPFLSLYVARLSDSHTIRSLVPVLWCAPAFISLAGSYISERIRRERLVIVASLVVMALVTAASGAAPAIIGTQTTAALFVLLAGILLANILSNLYFFNLFAWFPDLVDERYMGKLTASRLLVFWVVGAVVNPLAGEWLEGHAGVQGFSALYLAAGAMGVLAAVPLMFLRAAPAEHPQREAFLLGASQMWSERNFRMFLGLMLTMSMAPMVTGAYSAIFLSEFLRFNDRWFGLLNMLPSVAALVTVLGWGRMADTYGARVVMLAGIIGYTASSALMAACSPGHTGLVFPAYLVGGGLGSAFSVAWVPLMYALSPRHRRATAMGFVWLACATGGLVVPFLGGALVSALGDFSFSLAGRVFGPINVLLVVQTVVSAAAILFFLHVRVVERATPQLAIALMARRPLLALWQGFLGDQLLDLIRRVRSREEDDKEDDSDSNRHSGPRQ